jgi:Winged helix-turn-helix DNA-binding
MTPAEEARFIELWQQGASYAAIAQALGIPAGTVSSRAAALQRQGKIQPRPRGGAYPTQRAQGRSGGNGRDAAMRRNKIPLHRTGNDCIACSYSAATSASARSR